MRILFFLFLFSFLRGVAQPPGQHRGAGGRDSLMQKMPAIGKVTGSVYDSLTQKPAEFASVALMRIRDSVPVAGTLTDHKGNFTMTEVPFGRFILKISSIGYSNYSGTPLFIKPEETTLELGKIFIRPNIKRLKEVEVAGEKSEFINTLDRKVYNLDKNIVNTGGTATEVLRNIPSVTVDIDGNISLRGSGNVNVLIDGKPSGITGATRQAVLQQIPASGIDRIEVITNPSAKYDADGMAGIINIVTKKDKLKGLNANISLGVGSNEKYNLALGGNYRSSKFNVYTNYSFRHEKRAQTSESIRENLYGPAITYNLNQSHGNNLNDAHVLKGGLDYYLSESMTLGIGATASIREENRPEYINYQFEDEARVVTSSFIRENEDEGKNNSIDYNLDFKKTFRKSKAEWTASALYSSAERKSKDVFNTFTDLHELTLKQFQNNETANSITTVQTDYSLPLNTNSKLEAGWKSILRKIDAASDGVNFSPASDTYTSDPRFNDHFIYDEGIHAGYLIYSGRFRKFDYQLGVRGEDYLNSGKSETSSLNFENEYLNIYPSGFLKYNISKNQEVQVSYSRRVNRPESRTLNPFIDYGDTLNVRKGNPEVKPEYVDSYEMSYLKNFDKHSVNVTVYYRYTHNLITRYRFLDQSTNVTTSTFINFSSSENAGAEIVIKNQIGEAISIMTSGNVFQNKINGSNVEAELQSTSTNWNARMTINAKLAKNTSLQLSGMYMAPAVQPQGSFKGMSGVDAGIRQELWKGRGSLSLNVNDIFNTRKMVIRNIGDGYISDMTRTRESRVAMLNFSYRFGSADYNMRKKNQRNQNQQQEPGNMMDDF
ncbi:MAG: TonB-dependent receptor family protein [Bacteroidetes bacterium]|nr:TonB-dependent receptor family protein [Bacteroidota bacterium]